MSPGLPFVRAYEMAKATNIKEAAAWEAVEHLGLLTSNAVPTIVALLRDDMTEHPRSIATVYRKRGEQLGDAEKKALGIRRNGVLSRQAFAEITPVGLSVPLAAHETTLLRATFTLHRYQQVAQAGEWRKQLGNCFVGFKHQTLHRDCPACNRLDGLVTDEVGAMIFAPIDCSCPFANYSIGPMIDWLVDIE